MNADTTDPYVALAQELGRLGRRLDGMSVELMELRAGAGPAASGPAPGRGAVAWSRSGDARPGGEVASGQAPDPAVGAPQPPVPGEFPGQVPVPGGHPYPGPYPEPAPWWSPRAAGPSGGGWGGPAGSYAGAAGAAAQQRPRRNPLAGLSGARLLAWTGGAVTLLGVVLLLVLAASRGWFSPAARVTAGAVLGVALVGVGLWLHRKESARTGALALAATGVATLYLVMAAATALYGFLPAGAALPLALVVAAGGLGLADRWRSELLGAGVVAGAAVLAPVLVGGWLLVALVLALQVAALPVVLRQRWSVLVLVAAAGPVLFGAGVGATVGPTDRAATIAVVLVVLAVGIGTALPAARVLPVRPVAVLVAATPLPTMVAGAAVGGWGGAAVTATAAVALGAFAATRQAGRVLRVVAVAAGSVALLQATLVALDGSAATAVVLGEAVVATVVATLLRSRVPLVVGAVFGLLATVAAITRDAPLDALVRFAAGSYGGSAALFTAAGISALVLVFAVALLVAGGRLGVIGADAVSARLWVPVGLVGLYGATSLVVTAALLVSDDRAGFTTGHALVTVSWTVAALVLLARGISRPALRIAGMVLVGAAVAKLVLFDLVALDGLARVAAFLGAGLVLLAAGTHYARLVSVANTDAD